MREISLSSAASLRITMVDSEELRDIGKSLDVDESDIRDVRRAATRCRIMHVVKLSLPALSFCLGLLAGRTIISSTPASDSYPFLGVAGIQFAARPNRRYTWSATIVVSVVMYIFGFLLYDAMAQDSYGAARLYGPYSNTPAPTPAH